MGQSYVAVFLSDDTDQVIGHAIPQDYGSFRKLIQHGWIGDPFVGAVEQFLATPTRLVWAGEYATLDTGPEHHTNLFLLARSAPRMPKLEPGPVGRYVLNHDKQRYVDKSIVPADRDGDRMHPIVALTIEGCGFGFGDFRYHPMIGCWARDRISVADTVPEHFGELEFPLVHS